MRQSLLRIAREFAGNPFVPIANTT